MPAAAIAALSILLAAGLSAVGILGRVNGEIGKVVLAGAAPKTLPGWPVWGVSALLAFGLAFSILSVAGTWRHWVLWITAAVLVACWAPVLSLAAHAPNIAAPLIATVWSGVCGLVYARNQRMACGKISSNPSDEAR